MRMNKPKLIEIRKNILKKNDDLAQALRARWEEGWGVLFAALDGLSPDDLLATVTIRGEPHTVLEARQLPL